MEIYDSVALRRPTSFALNLKRLPTELVHQVIEELPLVRILQILAHKDPHLNNCVLSDKLWRRLFTKMEDITSVIDIFIIHSEICRFTRSPIASRRSILALGAGSSRFERAIRAPQLKTHLLESILSALPYNTTEMTVLEAHAATPYPGHGADVDIRWEWVKRAKRNLNKAKSRQLHKAADIMAQFPEMLMVKRTLDPDQGAPRDNPKHVENALRHRAKKILHNSRLLFPPWIQSNRCKDAVDNIELVPYDRYLWFFLDILGKHPFAEGNAVEGTIVNRSISSKTPVYHYPPEIVAEIVNVLKGISFLYTGSHLLIVQRVNWDGKPWATGPDSRKPMFNHEIAGHSRDLPEEVHRCRIHKVMTHDDREYEWLRSFLTVIKWMEKEFGPVPVPVKKE